MTNQSRGLVMRPAFIASARTKRRTHMFLPATFLPGSRTAVTADERARQVSKGGMRMPTPWSRLQAGDRIFVQEEIAALVSVLRNEVAETFYKLDLQGGHVPIPGKVRGGKWSTHTYPAHKCDRTSSRYTLEVTAVRLCRAQEVTWDEIKREGTYDPHSTIGSWWGYQYGILMPWVENPEVVGVDFTFTDGNIDTGQRWESPKRPEPKPNYELQRIFGTRAVKDD